MTYIRNQSPSIDRKSTRLNSSHTVIYTLSLHDALPIFDITDELRRYVLYRFRGDGHDAWLIDDLYSEPKPLDRSEEHTSELQSHRDLHSFPTRRSSDLRYHRRTPKICAVSIPRRWPRRMVDR